jgi:hypothetical protein
LPTRTRGDGRVDLRRRRRGIERGAHPGAIGNAPDYACLTPVDPPTRCDDRLGVSLCSKTQQKGGQPEQVFASHKRKMAQTKCRFEPAYRPERKPLVGLRLRVSLETEPGGVALCFGTNCS